VPVQDATESLDDPASIVGLVATVREVSRTGAREIPELLTPHCGCGICMSRTSGRNVCGTAVARSCKDRRKRLMTTQQATGLKRMSSIAGAGAAVAAIGMLAAVPTAIAAGLLVCWGGTFVTLIGYLDTVS
jgi:hypothetical protein